MIRLVQITNGLVNIAISKTTLYVIIVASLIQFLFVAKDNYAEVLYYYVIGLTLYAYVTLIIVIAVLILQIFFAKDVKVAIDEQREKDLAHQTMLTLSKMVDERR